MSITAAADDIHKQTFSLFFREYKTIFHVNPLLSSARQRIHMKHQALFSLKDKSKNNIVSSAAIFVWRFKG